MVEAFRIALSFSSHGGTCQCRFQSHDVLRGLLGACALLARKLKHSRDVLHVLAPSLLRNGVGLGVIIPVWHPKTRLVQLCDHAGAFLRVRCRTEGESCGYAQLMQPSDG